MARLRKSTSREANTMMVWFLAAAALFFMFMAYLLLWEQPIFRYHAPHVASRFKKYSKFSAHPVRAGSSVRGLTLP